MYESAIVRDWQTVFCETFFLSTLSAHYSSNRFLFSKSQFRIYLPQNRFLVYIFFQKNVDSIEMNLRVQKNYSHYLKKDKLIWTTVIYLNIVISEIFLSETLIKSLEADAKNRHVMHIIYWKIWARNVMKSQYLNWLALSYLVKFYQKIEKMLLHF